MGIAMLTSGGSSDAEQTVFAYHESLQNGDCEAYLDSTTPDFREFEEDDDVSCEDFASAGEYFGALDYRIDEVTDVLVEDGEAVVTVRESYNDIFDEVGEGPGLRKEDTCSYFLEDTDGRWRIASHFCD